MRLLQNTGNERVIDQLRKWLASGESVDLMSPYFSLHAFAEVCELLAKPATVRLLLGEGAAHGPSLFGGPADITYRSKLQGRWLARTALDWIKGRAEVRHAAGTPPQSM